MSKPQEVVSIPAYLIEYEGGSIRSLGMSSRMPNTRHFQQTMQGFQKLTDASKNQRQSGTHPIERIDNNTNLKAALQAAGAPPAATRNYHPQRDETQPTASRGMLIKVVASRGSRKSEVEGGIRKFGKAETGVGNSVFSPSDFRLRYFRLRTSPNFGLPSHNRQTAMERGDFVQHSVGVGNLVVHRRKM